MAGPNAQTLVRGPSRASRSPADTLPTSFADTLSNTLPSLGETTRDAPAGIVPDFLPAEALTIR
jgi:hypothetical protein